MKILSKIKSIKKESLFSFIAIVVMFYSLAVIGRAIFRNHLATNSLDALREEVAYMQDENIALKNRIAYLKTATYREREARAKLDLLKPGEKLVIIVDPKSTEPPKKDKRREVDTTKSNPEQWLEYFFPKS